ncbi:50S ribosomal protein L15 [Salinibacter sp. 10B]|uniref:50S ribosomal protein L15 n=1 Tax=Salinibacter sp. 10B TaxID=1923971 RepID=UPI000CF439EF|nr:50S ribosomal protein L15 [Salinibacter sp. 10B]PQJ33368.1 50S ribosomal protein L15 [Salinibacter sp. 10B]
MDLSNLKPAEGATKSRQRLGRGEGSGRGAHSSTRGTKGQSSRSGSKNRPMWFEGGQMPLFRRVPKHGFNNPFSTEYAIANVGRIQILVDEGRIDADEPITPEVLESVGAVRDASLVKILGDGLLDSALDISAHAFSSSAMEKIEDAGGAATVLDENE